MPVLESLIQSLPFPASAINSLDRIRLLLIIVAPIAIHAITMNALRKFCHKRLQLNPLGVGLSLCAGSGFGTHWTDFGDADSGVQ